MNGNFKTCARGHYYSATLDHCPYCPSTGSNSSYGAEATMDSTDSSNKTMDVSNLGMGKNPHMGAATAEFKETADMGNGKAGNAINGETKTSFVGGGFGEKNGETIPMGDSPTPQGSIPSPSERTMIFEDEGYDAQGQQQVNIRSRRKLVGWLVSYTLDDMGMDFKLYEGRNIIGRNADCQITIADKTVSGNHAVILFRAGKYSITDMQSSQGTFVNDEDIELEPRYLKDGDVIRMGQTLLRFRSSL